MKGLLSAYLFQHRKTLGLMGAGVALAALFLYLYHLPLEAALYLLLLWAALGLVLGLWDFVKYSRKHRQLQEMKQKILYSLEELPEPENLPEQDYSELLAVLSGEKVKAVSRADGARKELMDYYGVWVHQIKTPIAAMRLLLQSEENSQNQVLEAELFQIERYVEMALSYLRLNSDTTDFVFEPYSLDGIVRQAVKKYAPFFIHGRIRLDLKPLEGRVVTDEKWLVFVIEQILSNALKYTKKGKITIYETCQPGLLTLVIEDTGIGIAPEDLPRVCEKGFTGYNGRADKKASGIGLYLCSRILKKLSHTLELESRPGAGTKVKISFLTKM